MIDPFHIPKRFTRAYLEEFIIFSICVANKPAQLTAKKVEGFLNEISSGSPFQRVEQMIAGKKLDTLLRKHRMGQYKRIGKAFRQVVKLDLDALSVSCCITSPNPTLFRWTPTY